MNYLYYKDKKGNFGDDLNPWLWPKLIEKEKEIDKHFVGIGTVLFENNSLFTGFKNEQKIVFGSGVRPSYSQLSFDETWDIRFLRGPMSASFLDGKYKYITDAAYALRQLPDFDKFQSTPKKHEISFIPYFQSLSYLNWKQICADLNINYISPHAELGIDHILTEIASSKLIITEAMHGAIIADIFRIPWHRIVFSTPHNEGGMVSEFKWNDWMQSVGLKNIDVSQVKLYRKPFLHNWIKSISNGMINAEFYLRNVGKSDMINTISSIKNYYLSSDTIVSEVDEKIHDELKLIR
ncbi:polysaccharide pyruvyl transferase family protein [Dyadobacter diqingensis]|uniref:polysaccharide pyruvyl transferase family protein n=1 Tax=Dyadobacter diqingensis TaxID=2938121 RepID=UPI0020C1A1AD|nr:polysaccharide pyruvyl transferase family protein [Dyadobacter diqingensis]